jgi:single-strand DNA-binding protein
MMNSVNLIGRLTRDPERREVKTKGGEDRVVAEFRLAVGRQHGSDQADFITVESWGGLAEHVCKYLSKGRLVSVEGSLRHSERVSDDERQDFYSVRASSVGFLDAPAGAPSSAQDEDWVDAAPPAAAEPDPIY